MQGSSRGGKARTYLFNLQWRLSVDLQASPKALTSSRTHQKLPVGLRTQHSRQRA
jgi:hypothetical protein